MAKLRSQANTKVQGALMDTPDQIIAKKIIINQTTLDPPNKKWRMILSHFRR